METLSQVLFALNKMVDVNEQRSSRYKALSDKSKKLEMKLFFMQYAVQAQAFSTTLNKWRHAYGAATPTAKRESFFSSTVNHVKKFLGGRDYELRECEEMETNAIRTYKTALSLSFLPDSTMEDITKQTSELEKAHYTLKALRENGSQQWEAAFA